MFDLTNSLIIDGVLSGWHVPYHQICNGLIIQVEMLIPSGAGLKSTLLHCIPESPKAIFGCHLTELLIQLTNELQLIVQASLPE